MKISTDLALLSLRLFLCAQSVTRSSSITCTLLRMLQAGITIYRVAQKNWASVFHCRYFENSTTELCGNIASTCLLIYSLSSRLMTYTWRHSFIYFRSHTARDSCVTCSVTMLLSLSQMCGHQTVRTWMRWTTLFGGHFNNWFTNIEASRLSPNWSRQTGNH